jgi:hypothetical protein
MARPLRIKAKRRTGTASFIRPGGRLPRFRRRGPFGDSLRALATKTRMGRHVGAWRAQAPGQKGAFVPDSSEPRLADACHAAGPPQPPCIPPFVIGRGDGDGEWKPGQPQLFITPGSPFLGGERRASGNWVPAARSYPRRLGPGPYTASPPSSSSIRKSWLYLAMRSDRLAEPVLIWPALVATAMSAMVASSVSPER